MPSLKQLTCSIEWAETGALFQEYGTVYGDGLVETFIAVPETPQPFSIHLVSKGFIFDGLSMIVFIDGVYQCNRNRTNLRPFKKDVARNLTDIDLRLRQKEKPIGDGTYIGREWRFDTHNVVPELPPNVEKSHFDALGEIEVLVLRCRGRNLDDNIRSRSSSASGADSAPLEDRADFENGVDDIPPAYNVAEGETSIADAPTATDLPFSGLFDGASDRPDAFGLDGGPSQGYWDYWGWYPQQGHEGTPFGYGYSTPYGGLRPIPPRSSGPYSGPPRPFPDPHRDERRVHFDYGPPHRPIPPQESRRPPPASQSTGSGPNTGFQASNHSQGQPQAASSGWNNAEAVPQHARSSGPPAGGFQDGYDAASRYNDYVTYHTPPSTHQMPPFYPLHGYQDHPYWTPPQASPVGPSHHPQYRPGPEIPVFIPPYHPNHPYYLQSGNAPSPQGEHELPEWVKSGIAANLAGHLSGQDPAKDENNKDKASKAAADDEWLRGGAPNNVDKNGNGSNENKDESGGFGGMAGNTEQNTGEMAQGDSSNDNCGCIDQGDTTANTNTRNGDSAGKQDDQQVSGNGCSNDDVRSSSQQGGDSTQGSTNAPMRLRPMYGPHGPYYTFKSFVSAGLAAEVEEEPRYDVPKSIVDETGTSQQVQPGRGYLYNHKRCIPEYIDTYEEPYARFIFKYRTKEQLKWEIGVELDIEPSGNEEVQALQNMEKQQIINMLLRAQSALGGKLPFSPPKIANEGGEPGVMQPVAVPPPNTSFLRYSLPAFRNITNSAGPALSGAGAASNQSQQGTQAAAGRWDDHSSGQKMPDRWEGYVAASSVGEPDIPSWEAAPGPAAGAAMGSEGVAPLGGW